MERITINPVTRLEGHGKIDIFLDDRGDVKDAFFQVTELRGFERFCVGRPAEEMPRIVPNICGVCPTPHNLASLGALDAIYGVVPPPTAALVRRLQYDANCIEDHYIHFFFLAGPDFVVGPEAHPAERNILGLISKAGVDVGKKVIEVRKRTREIIQMIAGKPAHPEGGLPGGLSRPIPECERPRIIETADLCVDFAQYALQLFKHMVLANDAYLDSMLSNTYNLQTCYMGMVDDDYRQAYYGGMLRVVDPNGKELALFDPCAYAEHIAERVEPWTYIKLTYLRKLGWRGMTEGDTTSLYRVGPLARYNVAGGMSTPLAQKEHEQMTAVLGKPAHNTLAYHWARLVEALQAAEDMQRISRDPLLTGTDIRNMNYAFTGRGVGCVEAPRGVLIHDYETDAQGLMRKLNLVVATQHNAAPIGLSVKKAAQDFIRGGEVREGLLNMTEMAFRAYDPCLGCATHTLLGETPMKISIRDHRGTVVKTLERS
ncbi:MAG: Ni/Fe hydrogenase subunit alpha [Nitrospiraceae bacterium]|jgi:F420-non-reducing hydrogenase large subunit|nr:Ni/Fe hydrogenase subunit alpha [Nitrospiraceae bacterium]